MSPVWTPAEVPPVLDKYCHLSLDAQRVMIALYRDYHEKKAEIMAAHTYTPGVTDPSNYYRSLYQARFGTTGRRNEGSFRSTFSNIQTGLSNSMYNSDSRHVTKHQSVADPAILCAEKQFPARRLEFPSNNNRYNEVQNQSVVNRTKVGTINIFNEMTTKRDTLSDISNQRKQKVCVSPDTSNYSDSPPIETQDYRLLSQFHHEESVSLCDTLSGSSSTICNDDNQLNERGAIRKNLEEVNTAKDADSLQHVFETIHSNPKKHSGTIIHNGTMKHNGKMTQNGTIKHNGKMTQDGTECFGVNQLSNELSNQANKNLELASRQSDRDLEERCQHKNDLVAGNSMEDEKQPLVDIDGSQCLFSQDIPVQHKKDRAMATTLCKQKKTDQKKELFYNEIISKVCTEKEEKTSSPCTIKKQNFEKQNKRIEKPLFNINFNVEDTGIFQFNPVIVAEPSNTSNKTEHSTLHEQQKQYESNESAIQTLTSVDTFETDDVSECSRKVKHFDVNNKCPLSDISNKMKQTFRLTGLSNTCKSTKSVTDDEDIDDLDMKTPENMLLGRSTVNCGVGRDHADCGVGRGDANSGICKSKSDCGVSWSNADNRVGKSNADCGVGKSNADCGVGKSNADCGVGKSNADCGVARSNADCGVGKSNADCGVGKSNADCGVGKSNADCGVDRSNADCGGGEKVMDENPYGGPGPVQPVYSIFRKHGPTDTARSCGSKSDALITVILGGKRKTSYQSSFKVPMKKVKTVATDDQSSYKTIPVYHQAEFLLITEESWETICQLRQTILESDVVVVSLVYKDKFTQLRDNVFGQENKKRTVSKARRTVEVESFAVYPLGSGSKKVVLFPADICNSKLHYWTREFWETLLLNENIKKVGFQVKELYIELFRCYKFDQSKADLNWVVYDASIAWWLLDPDKPVSSFDQLLTALCMPQQDPNECSVAALPSDMALLSAAMNKLKQRLESRELWKLFYCLETRLIPVLAAMELRPICIATHTLLQFSDILKKKLVQLEQQAHKAAGHPFLLSSHHQLRQVLFEELRLDTQLPGKTKLAKTNVGKETSTSETVLNHLLPFHPLPAIVLEHRQLQKLKSTYIDGLLTCVSDSQLCTHWDQTAAATGRLTSYQPNIQAVPKVPVVITGLHTNFIPDKESCGEVEVFARDPFISRPGYTLLAADFQQIELRLLGHLANDPVLIKLFNDPDKMDIFNALTAQWLGKCVDHVTSTEREQTKRVVYSVMYGVGKEKLAEYLKISADNAKAIMASFLLKFPAVNQFTKSCLDFCHRHGYTQTIFNRRRQFPNIRHSNHTLRAQSERQCVNFCVQGSAADVCKSAMIRVEQALSENKDIDARLLVQIHDELLLEVADSYLNTVIGLVKSVMECGEKLCGSLIQLLVPIPVSISVGKKWGHMGPVIGEHGETS